VFYFQNLTALSEACEATETTAAETVCGAGPELGSRFHTTEDKSFPPKGPVVLPAIVFLLDVIPTDVLQVHYQCLDALTSNYVQLPKPEPKYQDLVKIAEESLQSITLHNGCWTYAGGHSYLNAYLGDYKTPAEIMVQLAVLLPLKEYLSWKGEENFIVS